ncbi:hypothetical protein BHAOGJBA_0178 [Methylobacterium hispanicum]|uniref:Apea-like HEPN domain-containing protein n=2 Tax=Methylobacteriaceae TaxID=119045 RepID=A0AAV4ZER0_9HYPH|nr:hypothetical protein BHAOGJBA_0178 [Methylobacterium hispanicum]
MADLLDTVIGDPNIALPVYFAAGNTEARFKIVDASLRPVFARSEHEAQIVPIWSKLLVTLNRLKETRNKVAHGMLGGTVRQRKTHIRWTGPTLDVNRWAPAGQLDGLSLADMQQCIEAIERAESYLYGFIDLVRGILGKHNGSSAELIAELSVGLSGNA